MCLEMHHVLSLFAWTFCCWYDQSKPVDVRAMLTLCPSHGCVRETALLITLASENGTLIAF
jgi:hypothetical protein